MGSFYLHIPFCLSKCFYCSFPSVVADKSIHTRYTDALKKEVLTLARQYPDFTLETLFVGGGTPSILPVEKLSELIGLCTDLFDIPSQAELSIEVNPGTVDEFYLKTLYDTGVNRISFGVQSFDDDELKKIGRLHDRDTALSAIKMASKAGFENINLDLMYGLPHQSSNRWRSSLQQALALNPSHLSLYQLTLESGTVLYKCVSADNLFLPEEDEMVKMDEITDTLCTSCGFNRYEIANYAKNGCECRHNINYWQNNEYLAAGAAAVSYVAGVRERRIASPVEYIKRINTNNSVIIESECLTREESFRESVIMGLRLIRGISRRTLVEKFGLDCEAYYGQVLAKLVKDGLVELSDSHMWITVKGRPFSNIIMSELV